MDEMSHTLAASLSATGNWTREQLMLAFYFYCQTPFGKLDSRNKQVVSLAKSIGRTPGALAMKLVNFASLDPAITESGRVGLSNTSSLDREIWREFHEDWEGLTVQCEELRQLLPSQHGIERSGDVDAKDLTEIDYTGESRPTLVQQRIKQQFFRRAVLSGYRSRCCISGLTEERMLVASHIVPWSEDKANRLNPSNGLCLSSIHDKAFDLGLISLSDNLCVLVSEHLLTGAGTFASQVFEPIAGKSIELPDRFLPDRTLISHHRSRFFPNAS
jgi:hypothetical protein